MKISEVIRTLENYRREHGDVELYAYEGDGRSSWVSGYKPNIRFDKRGEQKHMISQSAYGLWRWVSSWRISGF